MSMKDRERYGAAVGAGRLRQRMDGLASADTIAAAGLAGAAAPLGLALWRARFGNDADGYRRAGEVLMLKVAHVSRRRHWSEPQGVLKALARQVLQWAVFGTCPHCAGRGLMPLDAVPNVLSNDPCPACHGGGSTPIEKAVAPELVGRAKDIAQLLAEADDKMATAMHQRLQGRP